MNWTKDDLHAYLLIWCANADFIEFEEEVELILSQIDTKRYKALHREFEKDNDYQRIEKIKTDGLDVITIKGKKNTKIRSYHLSDFAQLQQKFDYIFMAVKAYDTQWVAKFASVSVEGSKY